jgi:hypothetical protein
VKSNISHRSHHSSRISRKHMLEARFPSGCQAARANSQTAPKLASRRMAIQKENQVKINCRIQEMHRNVATIVERINAIKTKIGVVRSKAVSMRTITKNKE